MPQALRSIEDCDIHESTTIHDFVNLYECTIGRECLVGPFVEIQSDVTIGDLVRVQSHSFICSKTTIEDGTFIGHGTTFVNDRYPPRRDPSAWEAIDVRQNVAIGNNATILPVEVRENALVGAGAVVVDDVPPNAIVAGNPAEIIGWTDGDGS